MACTKCPAYCHKNCGTTGAASSSAEYEQYQKFLCPDCAIAQLKPAAKEENEVVPPWRQKAQARDKKKNWCTPRGSHDSDAWTTVAQPASDAEDS